MMQKKKQSTLVGIAEIAEFYLPMSRRNIRKFVSRYLEPKRIGNRIYVDREELEALLNDPLHEKFPLV